MNTAASFYHRLTPSTHTATDLWITLCDVFISQVVIAKYWWSFLCVLYEKYMMCFSREEFKVMDPEHVKTHSAFLGLWW